METVTLSVSHIGNSGTLRYEGWWANFAKYVHSIETSSDLYSIVSVRDHELNKYGLEMVYEGHGLAHIKGEELDVLAFILKWS